MFPTFNLSDFRISVKRRMPVFPRKNIWIAHSRHVQYGFPLFESLISRFAEQTQHGKLLPASDSPGFGPNVTLTLQRRHCDLVDPFFVFSRSGEITDKLEAFAVQLIHVPCALQPL